MSTKAELLEIANRLMDRGAPISRIGAAQALGAIADRLDAVAVSDVMVESVGKALYIYWDDVTKSAQGKYREKVRHALESILPIADEQARDAERYRWLRDLSISMLCVRADRWNGMHNVRMIGSELDEAIDRSIASAKGDAR